MFYKYLLAVFLLVICNEINSQSKVVIKGGELRNKLPNATLKIKTKTKDFFFVTDSNGIAVIPNSLKDSILLEVSYVGYISKDTVLFLKNQVIYDVTLVEDKTNMLDPIFVKSIPKALQFSKGKFILTIKGNEFLESKNILNILKNAPFINLKNDGELAIKNKPATIYLNNRRIFLEPSELTSFLESLQGIVIEKIEIIDHPNASYSSDVASVIKIITRDYALNGFKGNVSETPKVNTYFNCLVLK